MLVAPTIVCSPMVHTQARDPRDSFKQVVEEELAKQPADAATACFPASRANANPEHCFPDMTGLWFVPFLPALARRR